MSRVKVIDNTPFSFLQDRNQAEFTNREEIVSRFRENLQFVFDQKNASSKIVTQFHGIGGIGKTRLISKLSELMQEDYSDAVTQKVDFDEPSVRDAARALLRLRISTRSGKRVKFPVFDFAYSVYFAKRNPDFEFAKKDLPHMEEASIVGDVIAAVDGLGIVGAVTGIVNQVNIYAKRLSLPREVKDALTAITSMTEGQIIETLPEFLAFDLNRHIKKSGGILVLFFDTYECLWHDNLSEQARYSTDSWVRVLVDKLAVAMIVISGREKIRWSDFDNKWKNRISFERVGRLSKRDTISFLQSAGVSDHPQLEKLVEVSNGHPYYLDLYLDTVHAEGVTNNLPLPTDSRELFERFVRALTSAEISLLKVLAPLNFYNLEYLELAVKEFNIPLTYEQLAGHARFSFVKEIQQGYTIHELMRKSLISSTSPEFVKRVREFSINHFGKKLAKADSRTSIFEIVLPLKECIYQLEQINSPNRTLKWLSANGGSSIDRLQKRAATIPLAEVFTKLEEILDLELWPLELQIAYADIVHLVGNYEQAVKMLTIMIQSQPKTDQILFAKVRRLHHSMMFRPIGEVWSQSEQLFEYDVSKFPDNRAFGELLFLIGGNLGCARGIQSEGFPWLIRSMVWAHRSNDETMKARVYRKAADFYRLGGNLKKSGKCITKGIHIAMELNEPRFLNYLLLTQADQQRLEKNFNKSIGTTEQLAREFAGSNLDGWLGHANLLHSALAYDMKNIELSKEKLFTAQRAYNRCKQKWGLANCELISYLIDTAPNERPNSCGAISKKLEEWGFLWLANWVRTESQEAVAVPPLTFL